MLKHLAERSTTTSALLLACLSADADSRQERSWRSVLDRGIDWDLLLTLGEHHDLLPLLFSGLEHAPPEFLPQSLLPLLRDHFQANHLRNRLALQCFLSAESALAETGVPALVLKGLALATTVYEHLAARQFGDVDLLIPENKVVQARYVLERLDYRPVYPPNMLRDLNIQQLTPSQERIYSAYYHELTLQSPDALFQLDMHWALVPQHFPIISDCKAIWQDAARATCDGRSIATLSAEHQIIHTCIHATKDRWRKLKWVVDLDRIVRADSRLGRAPLDWERLVWYAKTWRARRMVITGLGLAERLLATPIPESASRLFAHAASETDLSTVIKTLLNPEIHEPRVLRCLGINATLLRLLDTDACRRRYLLQALTMPRPEDEALFGPGPPNGALWKFRRPFWVLARCVGRIGRPRRNDYHRVDLARSTPDGD
ncbi:nucleotidyltransferase domain-containing protein [Thiocapsa bogorovii]|uniref:nucleotidyltransferase domain-containing protein n=1 Tax=Thiocapsa bogorovii TaxID=521689 RepID=UPI001E4185AA|nr:nucleotidyltransferase family protein [Thiocapsa bogorovii]UHD17149.1 nucleotidyltransferase family protein [Thiocapsa bogorovii]